MDRAHNTFGRPLLDANRIQAEYNAERMSGPAVEFSDLQRAVIDKAIREVAQHRRWLIHTLTVRTNHVHVVVTAAGVMPEKVMNDFKAWSTRRLREAGLIGEGKVWSRHGSTPHLYDEQAMVEAIHYVANLQ